MRDDSIRTQIYKGYSKNYCGSILCQLCNKLYWEHENFACNEYMFQAIKPQSQNLHWYLDKIIRRIECNQLIHLAVVGKDPYPSAPIGLPFAKKTLSETFIADSGRVLFPALGVDVEKWKHSGRDVKNLYKALCDRGIIFLNVSYRYLVKDFAEKRVLPYLKCANSYNRRILEKTNRVVLCGDADRGTKYANHGNKPLYYVRAEKPWHPSAPKPMQNASQNSQRNYLQKWIPYWGGEEKLLDLLEPKSTATIYHPIRDAISEINGLAL